MTKFIGSIITDCADPNARARQELAFKSCFDGISPTFVGVESTSPMPVLEVAGNLVDQLGVVRSFSSDATKVILVNVAPRSSAIKEKHDNGTPFCYAWLDEQTLLVSTLNECLTLARDLGIVGSVEVVHIPAVVEAIVTQGGLSAEEAEEITHTQFRSLNFLPRLARWVLDGRTVPSETQALDDSVLSPVGHIVWYIDSFQNGKTNILPEDIDFEDGKEVTLADGTSATCHTRLADVATGETALTIGSSGYGQKRWLEVVIGKGKAAEEYALAVGSKVLK